MRIMCFSTTEVIEKSFGGESFRLGLVTNPLVTREILVRYCLVMSFLENVNRSIAEGMKALLIPTCVIKSIHISSHLLREQLAC